MNESKLCTLLQRAAVNSPAAEDASQREAIMACVRVDEGRAQRWRSFVRWLLALVLLSGLVAAGVVAWSLASQDQTHARPPRLELFQEGLIR